MKKPLKKILIQSSSSITNTLKKLRATGLKCLIVVDKKKKYLGTITDGDIRNEILKNKDFTRKIITLVLSREQVRDSPFEMLKHL